MDKVQTILELTKRQNTSIVLYMIDIDYFKSYNDKYGHLYGDTVLKSVAKAISTTFTRISDVVCRYGGEEFLVCSVIKNSHEAEMMANQIQKNIRNLNIDAPNKTISPYLTVSVGYVVYNAQFDDYKSDTNINTLLGIADTALYKAKNSGRNKVESYIMPLINP
ncbi:MAG: GGDEF domain-containing protein [Oscillospiraceae bacterium]|nr:GGDEF domain-containing protein [Oscillospiraceae bacterium]